MADRVSIVQYPPEGPRPKILRPGDDGYRKFCTHYDTYSVIRPLYEVGDEFIVECICLCGETFTARESDVHNRNVRHVSNSCPLYINEPEYGSKWHLGVKIGTSVIYGVINTLEYFVVRCLCGNVFYKKFTPKRYLQPVICSKGCNLDLEREDHREAAKEIFNLYYKETPDGCWQFKGHTYKVDFKNEPAAMAYRIYNGRVPPGAYVYQLCGNENCVNPDHLILKKPPTWRYKW